MSYDNVLIGLEHPAGWVELPMAPEIPAQLWAERTVAAVADPAVPAEHLEASARDLAAWVLECRTRSPELAFAYRPDPLAPTVAVCEVLAMPAEDPPVTPATAELLLGRTLPGTIGGVEMSRRTLPAGPGVRMRQLHAGSGPDSAASPGSSGAVAGSAAGAGSAGAAVSGDRGGLGDQPVVEGVTWVVFPPGLDGVLFVTTTWTELVLGDRLSEQADRMAEGLSLESG